MQSPTILAALRYLARWVSPRSRMAMRTRRCTGFNPSRTSGSARLTITLME
ncbi:MAG: hypothetical protein V1918_10275 [Planctomycetota bacterium]